MLPSKEKGASPNSPRPENPLPKESNVILAKDSPRRNGEFVTPEKRGGSGTRLQASPDPRITTHLDRKSRVVE